MSQDIPVRHPEKQRWRILAIATVAQVSACFFIQGIGAIAAFLQRDLNLSTAQVALLLSAAQLVPLVGLLVAGELLDRYSERWVVGVGTLVVAVSLLIGGTIHDYSALLLVLLLVGAGYSVAQPGGSKSVAAWFPASQRGLAMGIRQAGLPLGGALAAASLPFFASHYGWRTSLVVGGLVALVGATVFMVFYRTPNTETLKRPTSSRPIRHGIGERFDMIREDSMRRIALSGASLMSVQYGILIFTELYVVETQAMRIEDAALFLLVAQVFGVAGRIGLAAWSDRTRAGRYLPVTVCMGAVLIGLLVLGSVPISSIPLAVILFAWLGFFGFGWYGPWVAYVADSAPPGKTGFALGFAMTVNQVAVIAIPPALGLLKDVTGSFAPGWLALAAMTAASAAATARTRSVK